MKERVILTSENVEQFRNALGMLDTSLHQLLRVAQNMIPETLDKLGLEGALKEICNNIDQSSLKVTLQFFGHLTRIASELEIALFHIAQELITNVVKHSQATRLTVHLIQEEKRINLLVRDNGKGFSMSTIRDSNGYGIHYIHSRVESLKGRFELISEPEKGTEITIQIPL